MSENNEQLYHAWLAGFFDGEGSVGLTSINRDDTKWRVPRITLCQKNELQLMEDIKTRYGGNLHLHTTGKNVIQWQLGGAKNVIKFLTDVLPYLKLQRKRNRAIIVLAISKLMVEKSWHNAFGKGSEAAPEDEFYRATLEQKFDELKEGEVQ